jgi:hypothetical protein
VNPPCAGSAGSAADVGEAEKLKLLSFDMGTGSGAIGRSGSNDGAGCALTFENICVKAPGPALGCAGAGAIAGSVVTGAGAGSFGNP